MKGLLQIFYLKYIEKHINQIKKNVTPIDFVIINKGKKTAAGHFGKAVKGEFIRYLAQNNITSIDDFGGFEYDGFKWDGISFIKEEK